MEKKNSEYWERRIADTTWRTYNSLEDKNRYLLEMYQDAAKSIREELYKVAEKYSKDGVITRSELYKYNRLKNIKKKFADTIAQLAIEVELQAHKNIAQGFDTVYQNTIKQLGAMQVEKPSERLMEELLDRPWYGDSFSNRIWKNRSRLSAALNTMLLTGIQQGKTVFDIAAGLNNVMGTGFNNAHRLVRTETMHYLNSAALQGYRDSGVKNVRFWAAEDERTCPECGKYHNKPFLVGKAPVLPLHPNCRCTYLPVVETLPKKSVKNYKKGDIIKAGGTSGGRKTPGWKERHAELEYEAIRKRKTDCKKISRNTGFPIEDIRTIKSHMFIEKHKFKDGSVRRFDADFEQVQAWDRLSQGKHREVDILLLKHELEESRMMLEQGLVYEEAHKLANEKYNWWAEFLKEE